MRKTPYCTLLYDDPKVFHGSGAKGGSLAPADTEERSKVADQDSDARGADGVSHMGPPDAGGGLIHEFSNLLGIVINYTALIDRQLGALERAPTVARWATLRGDFAEVKSAASKAARLIPQLGSGMAP